MAYSDPEKEKAFQAQYRAANVERRKGYDRDRYYAVIKPARAIANARALARRRREVDMGYQDCSAVRARHAKLRQEQEAESLRQKAVRKQAHAARQLARLRDRMRAAVEACIRDGIPISRASLRQAGYRGHCGSMGSLINELIEDGTIREEHMHRNRTKRDDWRAPEPHRPKVDPEEERVDLPPIRNHAPEVPQQPAAEKPIAAWLAERYWTPRRRAMYRGHG